MARTSPGVPLAWLTAQIAEPSEECILWPYSRDRRGYAKIKRNGHLRFAYHVALELKGLPGPDWPRSEAMHLCNRGADGCVNPLHIRIGTHAENEAHKTGQRRGLKLTREQVLEIRASEESQGAMAARYGVNQSLISRIRTGAYWKHL